MGLSWGSEKLVEKWLMGLVNERGMEVTKIRERIVRETKS